MIFSLWSEPLKGPFFAFSSQISFEIRPFKLFQQFKFSSRILKYLHEHLSIPEEQLTNNKYSCFSTKQMFLFTS